MRNVVSPRGPLSPKVYWRRRLAMLAVLVGVVLLVGQLFSGGAETAPVAERAGSGPTAQPREPAPTATTPPTRAQRGSATRRSVQREKSARRERATGGEKAGRDRSARRERTVEEHPALAGAAGPLATPSGACEASEVVIVPDVEDTDAFGVVPLRLGLSTSGEEACTFAFGGDSVALQITSGDDLIWQSLHCGRALPEQSVVVRPGWLSYVTVEWSGRRGEESCGDGNEFAQPGYYWAEAAAIGGEPERSQFELETPPRPTKEPEPEEDGRRGGALDDEQDSEQGGEQNGESRGDGQRGAEREREQRGPTATASPTAETESGQT